MFISTARDTGPAAIRVVTLMSADRGLVPQSQVAKIWLFCRPEGCYDILQPCRAVDLVATGDLEAGAELTLNYGTRAMRDMLRGYGFTPANAAFTDPSEVYKEIGESCETLVVQGSGKVSIYLIPSLCNNGRCSQL